MVITGAQERDEQEHLRDAAVAAVTRGWSVVPGTTIADDGTWRGRHGATTLAPISQTWSAEPITEWPDAHRVWSQQSLALLLACSDAVHGVEVTAGLGEQLRDPLAEKDLLGPTVGVHPARWVLLVEPGPPGPPIRPLDALRRERRVTYRDNGHWVPLPPTGLGHRRAQWLVPPDQRRLPPAPHVLQLVAEVTNASRLR